MDNEKVVSYQLIYKFGVGKVTTVSRDLSLSEFKERFPKDSRSMHYFVQVTLSDGRTLRYKTAPFPANTRFE